MSDPFDKAEFISTAVTCNDFNVTNYVRSSSISGLDLMTAGKLPANPAELLLHEGFKHILDGLSEFYDHIIIDSPPVLAVTDASIIGKMQARHCWLLKQTSILYESWSKRISSCAVKCIDFNDVDMSSGRYAYGGKYVYQYEYNSSLKLIFKCPVSL